MYAVLCCDPSDGSWRREYSQSPSVAPLSAIIAKSSLVSALVKGLSTTRVVIASAVDGLIREVRMVMCVWRQFWRIEPVAGTSLSRVYLTVEWGAACLIYL